MNVTSGTRTVGSELASYGFDDDGTPAEASVRDREAGILKRPLGGRITSQQRAGMEGVANDARLLAGTGLRSTAWRT